ncbi:MAG: winged helix-turn-helix domain-containing protein [Acidobacteria bacterium]|nr:winged helix-turn-helix domain-containing protein [Acidobacteriota bacterium]
MNRQPQHIYEFGPFRLDAAEHLLLRDGEAVPLTPKAFDLLLALVEHHGHLLEKDELLKKVWPDTFVEEANLASNISQLRKALGDGENGERYIETVPKRGYRFVAPMKEVAANGAEPEGQKYAEPAEIGREPVAASDTGRYFSRIRGHKLGISVTVAALIIGLAGVSYLRSSTTPPPPRTLVRLTFDAGLQSEPTWSPDGRWIAYSSDRGGNFDIWVKPVAGGDPAQVTKSPAHDWQPDWSPNGSQIVFRSERNGGGLFVAPPLGGAEQKIADFGYRPRWSRDGSQILFASSVLRSIGDPPKLYVVGLDGSPPREAQAEFLRSISYGGMGGYAWHPDGQRISVWGKHKRLGSGFWTMPALSGAAVRSEMTPGVEQQLRAAAVTLQKFLWSPSGRYLYFEGITQGVKNLWRVEVEPQTQRWVAGPERLTISPGEDAEMSLSVDGKKLAFATRLEPTRIWSFPFDAVSGKVQGDGQALAKEGVDAWWFDVTPDGRQLAFIVRHADKEELPNRPAAKSELWKKSLVDGKETLLLSADNSFRLGPHWAPDGSRLSYSRQRQVKPGGSEVEHNTVLLSAGGGEEQPLFTPRVNGPCCRGVSQWYAGGQWLLGAMLNPATGKNEVVSFPLTAAPHAETAMRVIAGHPELNFFQTRLSPDERWVAIQGVKYGGLSTIYVTPASGGALMQITEGRHWDDKPRWSPDGRTIYFVTDRNGFLNVWGIRFDPAQGKSVGEAFRVTAFESPSQMVFPRVGPLEMAIAGGRLFINITEATGSVWILENVDR